MRRTLPHLGGRLRAVAARRHVNPDSNPGQETAWDAAVSTEGGGHFRPDIEGLRAVAILAVLAHHAGLPGVTGGFVGVDIFFVISGFLITGLLVREYSSSGRIDLPAFYGRRARRLLPAALLVILVTVAGAWFILPSIDLPTVAGDGAAAALYVSNYRFALTATDYFAQGVQPSPLLHYWSLGVEEQFYFFWPLLILVAARWLSTRRLWWLLASVAVASFALSAAVTDIQAPWAFYSLPTRAWELALGALVAMGLLGLPSRWPDHAATIVGLAGAGMVAASLVTIDAQTPFPGYAAALPSVGAALLIIAGDRPLAWTSRLLATRVPRWFGRISYSLYLWHWPVLILVPQLIGRYGLRTRLALAVASIVVAAVSERLVERPFRFGALSRLSVRRLLAVAGTSCLVVALVTGVGAVNRSSSPTAARALPSLPPASSARPPLLRPVLSGPIPSDLQPPLAAARKDGAGLGRDGCLIDFIDAQPAPCIYGNPHGRTTVVLYGDSHAEVWLPALKALAAERDWRIVVLVKPACTFVQETVWSIELKRPFTECDQWRALALSRIATERPSITFVASSLNYYLPAPAGRRPFMASEWQSAMTASLKELQSVSERVVMFAETPHHQGNDPVACLARSARVEDCETSRTALVNLGYGRIEQHAAAEAGVLLLPVTSWLCQGSACPLIMDHYVVFRDAGHLTATITYLLAPQIRWAVDHQPT
jgi:peptidoglycan/LPS O-acetylase OafA/YrhL